MNVARLRELMNDLLEDMPVVVCGGTAGYDPLITAAVRLLGPTPMHFQNYDGVLVEEHLYAFLQRRNVCIRRIFNGKLREGVSCCTAAFGRRAVCGRGSRVDPQA